MNAASLIHLLRSRLRPLEPLPTGQRPVLVPCERIRAVLFDVYGTLVVSGAGELGTATAPRPEALQAALAEVGLGFRRGGVAAGVALLERLVRRRHAARRRQGIAFPEVEIRDVWRAWLGAAAAEGLLKGGAPEVDVERLALLYELGANPVWPMPGAAGLLGALRRRGILLGVVSNAQFFTRLLFPACFQGSLEALGFAADLVYLSYEQGFAKPDCRLFAAAAANLRRRGLASVEALYVGNDLWNDVVPAQALGLRTALFAGDRRSLRLRAGDPRVGGVQPDLVLTEWRQLGRCILGEAV